MIVRMFGRETVASLRRTVDQLPEATAEARDVLADVGASLRIVAAAALMTMLVAAAYVGWQIGRDL